jgi:hypothetical protein
MKNAIACLFASTKESIDLLENKCQNLKDIISVKNRKIIALID